MEKNFKKNIKTKHLKSKSFKSEALKTQVVSVSQWTVLAVLILTALIYAKALFNDFATFDDDGYLFDNPFIKNFSLEGVKAIFTSFYMGNYHPLTTITYLIEFHLFGLNPMPYHFLNVFLHLINTFLVFKLIEKLSNNRLTALLVSLLFAVHPMHVESVAWISERKDVLYTLFYFSTLLVYLEYLKSNKFIFYLIALALFVLSLLSKSAAVTLPVLLIAIEIYKKRKWTLNAFLDKLPFFLLSLLFGIIALKSQQEAIKDVSVYFTFIDRIFLFTYSICFYIVKLVLPFNMSAMHFYPSITGSVLPWMYYASLPFLLVLVWLIVRPSKLRREMLFGVIFFLVVISVMLQIVSVGIAIAAERYTYIAYLGLFYIIGQGISGIPKASMKKTALFVFGLFIITYSFISWQRIEVWKNGNSLFSDMIQKYPDSYKGYNLRGNFFRKEKDFRAALQDYNKSLQLHPNNAPCLIDRSNILIELKEYQAVINDCNLSIQLDSTQANAYINRGIAYDWLGKTEQAMQDYDKALQINNKLPFAYNNRSALKYKKGDIEAAIKDISQAIALDPSYTVAYRNRGVYKYTKKDFNGAVEDFNYTIKLAPNDGVAYSKRGYTKMSLSDTLGACSDWHKAQSFGSNESDAFLNQFCLPYGR